MHPQKTHYDTELAEKDVPSPDRSFDSKKHSVIYQNPVSDVNFLPHQPTFGANPKLSMQINQNFEPQRDMRYAPANQAMDPVPQYAATSNNQSTFPKNTLDYSHAS